MKTYFDLKEAIDPYSPQALGRKRNTMLRALTLDNSEFERWVHDRIVRFAERNGIPLQQLDVGALKKGFGEWQTNLQQSDKSYGEVQDQVSQYISRFMSVAPGIISRYQSGESAPVEEPMSPTMIGFEGEPGAEKPTGKEKSGDGEEQIQQPQYATKQILGGQEELQQTHVDMLKYLDFAMPTSEQGDNDERSNRMDVNEYIDGLGNEIMMANGIESRQEMTYDMARTYVESMRNNVTSNMPEGEDLTDGDLDVWQSSIIERLVDKYGLQEPQQQKEERARLHAQAKLQEKALSKETVLGLRSEQYEEAFLSALERVHENTTGKPVEKPHLSPERKKKIDSNLSKEQQAYFDIQAEALLIKMPFLKGATWSHLGTQRGTLSPEWLQSGGSDKPASRTSKTDMVAILADGNTIRYDEERGEFIRCSRREITDGVSGCTNQLNISIKKGNSPLMSGGQAESRAVISTAIDRLVGRGYTFQDDSALASVIQENTGADEETAEQRAKETIGNVQQLRDLVEQFVSGTTSRGQTSAYMYGGMYRDSADEKEQETQRQIDESQRVQEAANQILTSLYQSPEILSEIVYTAATGDGKFEEGSNHVATHMLSFSEIDPEMGPSLIPITRKWASSLVNSGKLDIYTSQKSSSSKAKKFKNLSPEEKAYKFWQVMRVVMLETEKGKEQSEQEEEDLPEQKFVSISKFLKEEEEGKLDLSTGLSSETKKYVKDALDWGFSDVNNLSNFFDFESDIDDIALPDFSKDFGDTYFKKELQDEPDLDIL